MPFFAQEPFAASRTASAKASGSSGVTTILFSVEFEDDTVRTVCRVGEESSEHAVAEPADVGEESAYAEEADGPRHREGIDLHASKTGEIEALRPPKRWIVSIPSRTL